MSKVLGMGNALVDILVRMDGDDTLSRLGLPKGSMQLVDALVASHVLKETEQFGFEQASGGSAANTIHGLANLGVSTGFFGKVGRDELGSFFREDLAKRNITPSLSESNSPTGKAIALISPDSERTFATYLGAAVELSPDEISESLFDGYRFFHIEGYLVQNHQLIEKALHLAKQQKLIVSLDLASYNVVEANLSFLKSMVSNYVDVLFANEEEARSFTSKSGIEALNDMASVCDIAVLKTGRRGSLIKGFDQTVEVGVIQVNSIDSTGAGDLYAAGFLYGLINKYPLKVCGQIGAVVAGHVIEVIGPKMDESRWKSVKQEVSRIEQTLIG